MPLCPAHPASPSPSLQDGAIALSSLALIAVARSGTSGPLASSPFFGLLVVLAMLEKLVRGCRLRLHVLKQLMLQPKQCSRLASSAGGAEAGTKLDWRPPAPDSPHHALFTMC